MGYVIGFTCAIRRHYVYKSVWNPVEYETLFCRKDSRQEAAEYDKHAIGIFISDENLVRHMSIELSNLIDYFLGNKEENCASAVVSRQRKREVSVVDRAKYSAFTNDLITATIQQKEIFKKNEALAIVS